MDFPGAVCDERRFGYVCKILDILISERLKKLGGQAQKALFNTIEKVIEQVRSTNQNTHIWRQLLSELNLSVMNSHRWGENIGSSIRWEQNRRKIAEWNSSLEQYNKTIEVKPLNEGDKNLMHLPYECLRVIMLCLSDHHDLSNAANVHPRLQQIVSEDILWRDLCWCNFNKQQIDSAAEKLSWEKKYQFLVRRYGLKECFTETALFCTHCKCVFWQAFSHPCLLNESRLVPVSPRCFIEFFSL